MTAAFQGRKDEEENSYSLSSYFYNPSAGFGNSRMESQNSSIIRKEKKTLTQHAR